jgi:hypothetical protein
MCAEFTFFVPLPACSSLRIGRLRAWTRTGERPHAASAQVEQRRAHPQVQQLPPGARAQPSPQPHALV